VGRDVASLKALDLPRDPRSRCTAARRTRPAGPATRRSPGRAEEVDDEERKRALVAAQGNEPRRAGPFHLFRADIASSS
jgi:hypothetical protein